MELLRLFTKRAGTKAFTKDEIIISQGMPHKAVYTIKSGIVRCYDISLEGTEQLIWLAGPGDIFPLPYLFNVTDTAQFFCSAFSDVVLSVMDKQRFRAFLKRHPATLFDISTQVTQKYSDLQFRISAAGKPKAREKILHTLAFIADRFPNGNGQRRIELSLPLTHQDIADLVGLTRETTATTLSQLRDEGFIKYDRLHFVVYRDKIENILW